MLTVVAYEFRPEPTPAERQALMAALERALGEEPGATPLPEKQGAWWRTGVQEGVGTGDPWGSGGTERHPVEPTA